MPLLAAMLSVFTVSAQVKMQKFFNLTADEVRMDSVPPLFTCSIPLDGAWRDSVYSAGIEYPEFLEMGEGDIGR